MQQAFGFVVVLGCIVWGCFHLAEMLGVIDLDDKRIDRCPHCGVCVKQGDDFYIDDNELYHGYCWDKTRGQLKGALNASQ